MTIHDLHAQLVALSRVCDTLAADARTPAHGRAIDTVGRELWRQAREVKRVTDEMEPQVFEQPKAVPSIMDPEDGLICACCGRGHHDMPCPHVPNAITTAEHDAELPMPAEPFVFEQGGATS